MDATHPSSLLHKAAGPEQCCAALLTLCVHHLEAVRAIDDKYVDLPEMVILHSKLLKTNWWIARFTVHHLCSHYGWLYHIYIYIYTCIYTCTSHLWTLCIYLYTSHVYVHIYHRLSWNKIFVSRIQVWGATQLAPTAQSRGPIAETVASELICRFAEQLNLSNLWIWIH